MNISSRDYIANKIENTWRDILNLKLTYTSFSNFNSKTLTLLLTICFRLRPCCPRFYFHIECKFQLCWKGAAIYWMFIQRFSSHAELLWLWLFCLLKMDVKKQHTNTHMKTNGFIQLSALPERFSVEISVPLRLQLAQTPPKNS